MNRWESLIEKQIREAMEQGAFDDLPGKGKPLDLVDNPFEDRMSGTMRRILRDHGVSHPLVEARRMIEEELEQHRAGLRRSWELYRTNGSEPNWLNARETFRAKVRDLNKHIKLNNLKAPLPHFHIRVVDIEAEIRQVMG